MGQAGAQERKGAGLFFFSGPVSPVSEVNAVTNSKPYCLFSYYIGEMSVKNVVSAVVRSGFGCSEFEPDDWQVMISLRGGSLNNPVCTDMYLPDVAMVKTNHNS
jgi:hypothetical protein